MKFRKNSWHYKIYTWFKGYPPETTNLCPYCRTVFLWAPLRFLFGNGFIWKIPFPVITYLSILAAIPMITGMHSYRAKVVIYAVYEVAATVITSAAVMIGTGIWLEKWASEHKTNKLRRLMTDEEWAYYLEWNKNSDALPERLRIKKTPLLSRIVDWVLDKQERVGKSLVRQYIKAKHEKICPIVTFE